MTEKKFVNKSIKKFQRKKHNTDWETNCLLGVLNDCIDGLLVIRPMKILFLCGSSEPVKTVR
jgi:hypothetical protein